MEQKLLICTQKIDKTDPVLGFFHEWVAEFSKHCESITVICLEKGEYSLPQNVRVLSLGKELKNSSIENSLKIVNWKLKISYVFRFYKYIWMERKNYDSVFVHMNPEYIILAGILWRFAGKKIVLWYNHNIGTWKTKIAIILSNFVCHTSPFAYTANTKKSIKMPAGINTEIFTMGKIVEEDKILYLGRIAPIKKIHILIEAAHILSKKQLKFKLNIYGDSLLRDRDYNQKVKRQAETLIDLGIVNFFPGLPNMQTPEIYRSHKYFVNLTPKGNYDKTVLEAASCGCIPVASSPAFLDFLGPELRFTEDEPESLSKCLENLLLNKVKERDGYRFKLREYVVNNHNTSLLVKRVFDLYE